MVWVDAGVGIWVGHSDAIGLQLMRCRYGSVVLPVLLGISLPGSAGVFSSVVPSGLWGEAPLFRGCLRVRI